MPDLVEEDETPFLLDALRRAGLVPQMKIWSDQTVAWGDFDLVVVRGTCDYIWRRGEFIAWARTVSRLYNPAEVLEWNTDKRYLSHLSESGVPVVPTEFISPGDPIELPDGDIVVKPAVSMGAFDTERFAPNESDAAVDLVRRLLQDDRTVMIQPYRHDIDEMAEAGLIYLDGEFSHAIRKEAMLRTEPVFINEIWREQIISALSPKPEEIEVAEAALDAVPAGRGRLLYARVDVIPGPDGPEVIEVEATEPALYFQFAEGSADRFVEAILRRIEAER
jgi:glutathione synthase/RimK-type ligase-like ATP-grasp enzyme